MLARGFVGQAFAHELTAYPQNIPRDRVQRFRDVGERNLASERQLREDSVHRRKFSLGLRDRVEVVVVTPEEQDTAAPDHIVAPAAALPPDGRKEAQRVAAAVEHPGGTGASV